MPGSIGVTDGTWTPFVLARMIFERHNSKNSMTGYNPDLCRDCVVDLLTKMAAGLKPVEEDALL